MLQICAAGIFGNAISAYAQAQQTDAQLQALRSEMRDAKLIEGTLKIEMPVLAENGNAVALSVTAPKQKLQRIVIVAEKNPLPIVMDLKLGALVADAPIATRVRLGASQRVLAYARTTAGDWHVAGADVLLTASACYDGT